MDDIKTPKKAKTGRPLKKIDLDVYDLVYDLARIHCSRNEIAMILDIDVKTLRTRFSHVIDKAESEGKSVLRKGLWDLAKANNLGALIWLSKQHLGMADKVESKNQTKTETTENVFIAEWGTNIETTPEVRHSDDNE